MTIKRPTGHTLDSIRRQYKGGPDYKIEDKIRVINWYKKAKKNTKDIDIWDKA